MPPADAVAGGDSLVWRRGEGRDVDLGKERGAKLPMGSSPN